MQRTKETQTTARSLNKKKVFISEIFSGNKYTSTCLALSAWCTEHAHDTPFLKMDNMTALHK